MSIQLEQFRVSWKQACTLLASAEVETACSDLREEGLLGLWVWTIIGEGRDSPGYAEALEIFKGETALSLQWLAEIARLDGSFHQAGCDVVVLKGGALLCHSYREAPGVRYLSDLDLMVRQEHLPEVIAVLESIGYSSKNGLEYHHKSSPLVVDLHTDPLSRLSPAFAFSVPELWAGSLVLDKERYRHLRRLGREDQYLHLALHALKHGYERLGWLVDLAVLHDDFEVETLLERARRCHAERVLSYTFHLLEALFGLPLPEFQDRLPRLNRIERAYLKKVCSRDCPRTLGKLIVLFSIPGWRQRVRYFWGVATPQVAGQSWGRRLRGLAHMAWEVLYALRPSKAQHQD